MESAFKVVFPETAETTTPEAAVMDLLALRLTDPEFAVTLAPELSVISPEDSMCTGPDEDAIPALEVIEPVLNETKPETPLMVRDTVWVATFPTPPTLRPVRPVKVVTELGKVVDSRKLAPDMGATVSFPEVLKFTARPEVSR
jgi:hypothetical protein